MSALRGWQVALVAGLVVAVMSACGSEDAALEQAEPSATADVPSPPVEASESAFDESARRELASSVLIGSDAVVRGRIEIDGERADPFPGQLLFEARLTVEEVLLAPQADMLGRPLRNEGDSLP